MSRTVSEEANWQTILAAELMEKSTITPRTLSILKDDHELCDPNVVMTLRHDKTLQKLSRSVRGPIGEIMTAARSNLKAERREKAFGPMNHKLIEGEMAKFKEHLSKLKRINAASNLAPPRKPLRVRSQKISYRSRSCGSQIIHPRTQVPEKILQDREVFCLPSRNVTANLITNPSMMRERSLSVDSLSSDTSLPTICGSNLTESAEIHRKGPNTTPISFYNNITTNKEYTNNKRKRVLEKEQNDGSLYWRSNIFSEFETTKNSELDRLERPQYAHVSCAECGQCDNILLQKEENISHKNDKSDGPENCGTNSELKTENQNQNACAMELAGAGEAPLIDQSRADEAAKKKDQERKQKVKDRARLQLMSYVCNKTSVNSRQQTQNTGNNSASIRFHAENERSSSRERKIAMVLHYLERVKESPGSDALKSSLSDTDPEATQTSSTKTSEKMIPTISLDLKTVKASSGPHCHRLQAQRDLIKQQKMKLEEQEKKINELTLAKLQEEAKRSQQDFKRSVSVFEEECTTSIKSQLQTLKATANQNESTTAQKFVERMEQRAQLREYKKQLAAERQRVLEEERKKKLKEEEERRIKEEEEKKRQALRKIREENMRQREMREMIRREQEKMFQLNKQAETFNKRRLCLIGMRAFKKLMIRRDEYNREADRYYKRHILKTAMIKWRNWVENRVTAMEAAARLFYDAMLLRNAFNVWKEARTNAIRLRQVAEDMYEMRLQEKVFRKWCEYTIEQHLKMADSLAEADKYYERVLLRKSFHRWRSYPKIAHLEREKERRKMILRQRVQDMLPDFQPIAAEY